MSKCIDRSFALLALALCMPAFADVPVPAPGASPRIDAIKKAGVLRIGVLANAPWLVENTTGQGAAWSGPAWLLANEYAKRLNVKLEAVPVSHETKVPVLAAGRDGGPAEGRRLRDLLQHQRVHVRSRLES